MNKLVKLQPLKWAKRMNLKNVEIVHKQVLQKAEGTLVEIKGVCDFRQ